MMLGNVTGLQTDLQRKKQKIRGYGMRVTGKINAIGEEPNPDESAVQRAKMGGYRVNL